MDPSSALSELKLELPTTEEAIRRAYLRGVKAHPPERDPEGFQRVRAAYDFLRENPWAWSAAPTTDDDEHTEDEPEFPGSRGPTLELRFSAEPAPPAPANEPHVAESDFAQASGAEPDLAQASGAEPEVVAKPKRLSRAKRAKRMIEEFGDATQPFEPIIAVPQAIDCALGLFEREKPELAARLVRALNARIERDGVRVGEIAWFAAQKALVDELAQLHELISPETLAKLASGVQKGYYYSAGYALDGERPDPTRWMKQLAPNLHRAVLTANSGYGRVHRAKETLIGAGIFAAFWAVRHCSDWF